MARYQKISPQTRRTVAVVTPTEDVSEGEANKRIIAASPELLQSLKDLVEAVPLSRFDVRKDFSLINRHAQASKLIHRLEQQAEGKAVVS